MDFNPVKLILLFAWILSGIYLLDRINAAPGKWSRNNANQGEYGREWFVLFFGPGYWLWHTCRGSWINAVQRFFRKVDRKMRKSSVTIIDSRGVVLFEDEYDNPAVDEIKNLIQLAINRRASDIFIDPAGNQVNLRFRCDGAIIPVKSMDMVFGDNVISAIKVCAGMDITEKRRPQDGSFSACHSEGEVSFRVATVGAFGGEKVAIRLLGSESGPTSLEAIGFSSGQLELLRNAIGLPSGMILMCGGTGSGKTTTLYALINNIDYSLRNVISIEDPVERVIPNISQMEVNAKADISFAKLLRNALRQNPDVICVGEIRDEETAAIAVHAAQTGHLIISTIHSNDTVDTIDRMSSLGIPLRSLAATIKIIINQRLARRLCEKCKKKMEQIPPEWQTFFTESQLEMDHIYAPVGCPECNGTGYSGRVACFEILVIDTLLRSELEQESCTLSHIRQLAIERNGGNSLQYHSIMLAVSGITSLAEVERVTRSIDGGSRI